MLKVVGISTIDIQMDSEETNLMVGLTLFDVFSLFSEQLKTILKKLKVSKVIKVEQVVIGEKFDNRWCLFSPTQF